MSYILEALKKAQAERQLGNAPTIHAPPLVGPAPAAAHASRKPLLIGLGAGALVVAVAAVVAWRQQGAAPASPPRVALVAAPAPAAPPAAPAVVPEPASSPAPAVVPEPASLPAPAVSPRTVAHSAIPASASRPAPAVPAVQPAPVPPAKAAVAEPVPRRLPEPAAGPANAGSRPGQSAERGANTAAAAPAAPAAQQPEAEPAAYASVRGLLALPEVIQREVPKVVVGGYIYSQNPADRLLLVDKTLRREGEEVAPGLVLERLLPKAAVMNYRGYRYRVAY